MATAVPIPEYLKPERRIPREPSEFWKELSYIPREEELYDVMYGPEGYAKPKTVTGGIGRMIRKNILDPFYKGGLVTGRARRGQPPTPVELLEVSALGALPRVSGGLGSGPGLARPFRSRLVESLRAGRIGKRELGKAPKAQSLEAAIKSGGFHPDELKYSGLMEELRGAAPTQRVLLHDVVAKAEKNLPIPLKKTVLSEEKYELAKKVSDALAGAVTRRISNLGRRRRAAGPLSRTEYESVQRGIVRLQNALARREPTYKSQPQYTQYATPGGTKHKETLYHWEPKELSYKENIVLRKDDLDKFLIDSGFFSEVLNRPTVPYEVSLGVIDILTNPRRYDAESMGMGIRGIQELNNLLDKHYPREQKWRFMARINDYLSELQRGVRPKEFRSQHFMDHEKNLLAHTLTDVRKVEGKQVTNLSEIQSDWLQQLAAGDPVPEAPFRKDWYKVLGRDLVNQAIEEGSEGITWSTSEILSSRYSPIYQKFYQDLYDKKIPMFFKKEYGVTPKKVRGPVGSKTVISESPNGEDFVVGWSTDYMDDSTIVASQDLFRELEALGAPERILNQLEHYGEPIFYNYEDAQLFKSYIDRIVKDKGNLWYIPITDKMRQLVKEGQFQAAAPRKREEAVA